LGACEPEKDPGNEGDCASHKTYVDAFAEEDLLTSAYFVFEVGVEQDRAQEREQRRCAKPSEAQRPPAFAT
jgi:hypothetical protein